MEGNRKQNRPQGQGSNLLENLFIVILVFYPLRHIGWGLDLWDTGYNYANFQYMGTEHMDPMWLFSTYLANVTGNLLTRLPNADTLRGMNLYTGLFVSGLALAGYFFCTRKLKMPKWIAFVGEMTAVSLCWCPTALLYNYLTYALFLASTIFLYLGLTKEKKGYLICAGALLGSNVLVRFANLPEMGMIVAVWAYDLIVWLEEQKIAGNERTGTASGKTMKENGKMESFFRKTARHTLWCLAGYAAALVLWFSYIHICYGMNEYIAGIGRLFAMTENAVDYKPSAMILGILGEYIENMYWVIRLVIIAVAGMVLFALAAWPEEILIRHFGKQGDSASGPSARAIHIGVRGVWAAVCAAMSAWLYSRDFFSFLFFGNDPGWHPAIMFLILTVLITLIGARGLWAAVCAVMIVWLYSGNFFSFLFYSYDPIWHPGPVFLMLTMLVALIRIFHRDSPGEEKLISGMVILIILLTPIGSNNGVLPSLNNLFLAAPYTLWESWRFIRYRGDIDRRKVLALASSSVKGVLTTFLALCLFVFGTFGVKFAFAEATGIQGATEFVENNPVLKNVKMNPERAQWMYELTDYVNEEELQGKEVILYGKIPALSYYLQMPSAFNPWSDLDSYQPWVMEEELEELKGKITLKGAEKPVIILEDTYALFEEQMHGGQTVSGLSSEKQQELEADSKWMLLLDFMDALGYEQTFRNVKFAVYR